MTHADWKASRSSPGRPCVPTDMTAYHVCADVSIENHGSVFLFRPGTERGRMWLDENTEGTWFGGALAVEHRFARDLADGMVGDGLEVD